MSTHNQHLENEIRGCRELLTAFQQERQYFLNNAKPELRDILPILEMKKKLAGTLSGLNEHKTTASPDADRDKLRELKTLLEQLLMIDRENELLLRRAMDDNSHASAPSGWSFSSSAASSATRKPPPATMPAPARNLPGPPPMPSRPRQQPLTGASVPAAPTPAPGSSSPSSLLSAILPRPEPRPPATAATAARLRSRYI